MHIFKKILRDSEEQLYGYLVQESQMNLMILESAEYNQILRIRLTYDNDLITAYGKHHSSCRVKLKR